MYERIVVPLDGSELAEQALVEATQWAVLTGAPVHLVQVIEITQFIWVGSFGMDMDISAKESTAKSATAAAYLAMIAGRLSTSGLAVETEVRGGQVVPELVAATRPGDLIVMASHGRSGVARWFLGSVAENMVRHATVPILLVRSHPAMGAPVVSDATAHANKGLTGEGAIAPNAAAVRSRALRLLDKDRYSPEEASYLLGIPKGTIHQAAFAKQLTAEIIGHNVISIGRDDLLVWLEGNTLSGSTIE